VDPVAGSGTASWHTEYDADGNPWRLTDPKNQVTVSTYEVGNRVKRQEFSSPVARELPALNSIDFAHDGNGNLTGADEAKTTGAGPVRSSTVRVFDALDRLKSETRDGRAVQYTYDEVGNRASVTDPTEVATSYTYDALNRLSTATTPQGVAQYSYWPDSLLKRIAYPNGLSERRCYDDGNRLTDLVAAKGAISEDCATAVGVASRYGYSYDADGNRKGQLESRTDSATGALRTVEASDYGYDALDRLQAVRYADGKVVAYDLDAVGNRRGERESTPGAVQASGALPDYAGLATAQLAHDVLGVFNAADWLLSRTDSVDASGTVAFGYDLDGNQISRTTGSGFRTLAWDARNTLTAVYENGTEVARYDYDRNLQRVWRRTANETVAYVIDDKFVLNELDASQTNPPSYRRYHYAMKPLAVDDHGVFRFLSTDALGSVSDFSSTTGDVVRARQYDAWGGFRNGTGPGWTEPKLGFTGHQFDPETGNHYFRARYYDAGPGVFLSRDSYEGELANAPSLHRFAYAWANPTRYVDLSGYEVGGGLDTCHSKYGLGCEARVGEFVEGGGRPPVTPGGSPPTVTPEGVAAGTGALLLAVRAEKEAEAAQERQLLRDSLRNCATSLDCPNISKQESRRRLREEFGEDVTASQVVESPRGGVEKKLPGDEAGKAPMVDPPKPGAAPMVEEQGEERSVDLPGQPGAPKLDPDTGQAPMEAGPRINLVEKPQRKLVWTPYGGKHVASTKVPWDTIVSGTEEGPAKYIPGTDIESLERSVWVEGTRVTTGKSWKVMEFANEVGASGGRPSRWVRVEYSSGTIHGHPITEDEYKKLTKPEQ
jgi:RHS repeat-associated protein